MSETVSLSEYEDQRVPLDRDDAEFVANRLANRIVIRRELRGDVYVLNPHQFVGRVTLPTGRRLVCRPKVPVRNLFLMLAAAYDLPDPFADAPTAVGEIDEILAFVVGRFAALVEQRLDMGLYRAYVEEEENLSTVRGRIAVVEDLRLNYVLRHRTYCRFAEYSWDVPENRVVRQVVRMLARWGLPSELRRRLWRLDAALEEITPGRFVAADLDRFAYNRLNEDYRRLHRLCRLFLEGASPSDDTGAFDFDAFLIDMNRLFESFVTQVLKESAPPAIEVRSQAVVHLDRSRAVPMRPDLLIRRAGRTVVVADCKYKRIAPGDHRPHDLYQMLAYCTSLGVDQGVLIYPVHLVPVGSLIAIQNADVVIRETAINLSGDPNQLKAECERLTSHLFEFAA